MTPAASREDDLLERPVNRLLHCGGAEDRRRCVEKFVVNVNQPLAHVGSISDEQSGYIRRAGNVDLTPLLPDCRRAAQAIQLKENAMSPAEMPPVVDRARWHAAINDLRVREKAHTHEGDAIAAARRRLPMVEIDASTPLIGRDGQLSLLDAFEGRRLLIAYYFMWNTGAPAAEQCEGSTHYTAQIGELSYLHARDVTFAEFAQGPFDQSVRYRDFMGWDFPWYSAEGSLDVLLESRKAGLMHIVCYLRDGDRVFETYWTTRRGVEAMDYTNGLLELTAYGRQESWEDSPPGWLQHWPNGGLSWRKDGRPTAQWSRLRAGRSDDLGTTSAPV